MITDIDELIVLNESRPSEFRKAIKELVDEIKELRQSSLKNLSPATGDWMLKTSAQEYIDNYEASPESFFVNPEKLSALCNMNGIVDIQVLPGIIGGKMTLFFVGVDSDNNHVYYIKDSKKYVLEFVQPCARGGCGRAGVVLED